MLAIRYRIALPRDYDMNAIRQRVATKGHALDDYQGIERDFGRPVVDSWALTSVLLTEARLREARYATLTTATAAAGKTLDQVAAEHKAAASLAMARKDIAATVRGVELATGHTMAFTALARIPRNSDATVYEVTHVSGPGRDS